jgi:hypothetical protein
MIEASTDLLLGITEFSVGLGGFSGIVVVFAGRDGGWARVDRYRSANLISNALIPAFVAFLALGLNQAPTFAGDASRVASATLAIAIGATTFLAFSGMRSVPQAERALISPYIFVLLVGGSIVNGLVQLGNVLGFFGQAAFVVLFSGLVWQLAVAAIQFARIVFIRPGAYDDA